MKHTPSWFEHVDGQPAIAPAVKPSDTVEFTESDQRYIDDAIQVDTLRLEELTPEQMAAYERAFE